MRSTLPAAAATALLATLSLAASADAATYCVNAPGCDGSSQTLGDALELAAGSAADDRIEIGPGKLKGHFAYDVDGLYGDLTIAGAGAGKTTLEGTGHGPVLKLMRGGLSHSLKVEDLRVTIPPAADKYQHGIITDGADIDGVTVDQLPPAPGQYTMGITSTDRDVELDGSQVILSPSQDSTAVFVLGVTDWTTEVHDSILEARTAISTNQKLVVGRSRLRSRDHGIHSNGGDMTVRNSLLQHNVGTAVTAGGASHPTLEMRNVTTVGGQVPVVRCKGGMAVKVRSSITYGAATVLQSGTDKGCDLKVAWSRVAPQLAVKELDHHKVSALDEGGNTTAEPKFVNAAAGDHRLRQDSPLVDQGQMGDAEDLGEVFDIAGKNRVVDGDFDGIARRDMGAFELEPVKPLAPQPQPPAPDQPADQPQQPQPDAPQDPQQPAPAPAADQPAPASQQPAPAPAPLTPPAAKDTKAPKLTKLSLTRKLTFTLDEAATVKVERQKRTKSGKWVTVSSFTLKAKAGRTSKRVLKGRGTKRLRLVATDKAGNRAVARTVAVRG